MSYHIDAARRALHNALVELDRTDPAAVHEAGRWTARALGILFDVEREDTVCPECGLGPQWHPPGLAGEYPFRLRQCPPESGKSGNAEWVAAVISAASEGKTA